MASLQLTSGPWTAVLDPPGTGYSGSRFDWTTQVVQVTGPGRTFLSREKASSPDPSRQGRGLMGEFGIDEALGFEACPVGGWFPKVGVGFLQRPDLKKYHFARAYDLRPAAFLTALEGPDAVVFSASAQGDQGWAWALTRRWSLEGGRLTLETTLQNPGTQALATEEYIHNFCGFDGSPLGPGWSLEVPGGLERTRLDHWVDPEGLMAAGREGTTGPLTFSRNPARDLFFVDTLRPPAPTWTLRGPGGASVSETCGFVPDRLHFWAQDRVASPELYRKVEVAPGQALTWVRRWDFSPGAPQV